MADWRERVAVLEALPVFAAVVERGRPVWVNRLATEAQCGELLATGGDAIELSGPPRWLSVSRSTLDAERELVVGVEATATVELTAMRSLLGVVSRDPIGIVRALGLG